MMPSVKINTPGGFYLIRTDDAEVGDAAEAEGFGLHPSQDLVIVTTMNLSDDKRVLLTAGYWSDGEPTDLLTYWAPGWEQIARAEVTASDVLRLVTATDRILDLTPGAGRFGLAVHARMAPEDWPAGDPREHHMLACWSLTPGDARYHTPQLRRRDDEATTAPAGPNFASLLAMFRDGTTPLVRTDFTDDAAWSRVVAAVTASVDFGGEYIPNVRAVSEREFEGLDAQTLGEAYDEDFVGYVLLADDKSMDDGDEITVVYVDLYEDAGRSFRCAVTEIASIESNLSISNMDFEDFAENVDPAGVFRGFPSG
jgi:hypothetical protein